MVGDDEGQVPAGEDDGEGGAIEGEAGVPVDETNPVEDPAEGAPQPDTPVPPSQPFSE